MRLSSWRTRAPVRDALGPKVLAVVEPVLTSLGAEVDPHAWIVWGDDPGIRYPVLVPTAAGLVVCHVRVNVPGEGPRASGKLVRWPRVQIGELAMETQAEHRFATFQVENQVVRAADADADAVAEFAIRLLALADGRPAPEPAPTRRRSVAKGATNGSKPARPARVSAKGSTALTTTCRPFRPASG